MGRSQIPQAGRIRKGRGERKKGTAELKDTFVLFGVFLTPWPYSKTLPSIQSKELKKKKKKSGSRTAEAG